MSVSTDDVDGLWRAIDTGDGLIDKFEFLESFSKLDGYTTAVDALSIKILIGEDGIAPDKNVVGRKAGPNSVDASPNGGTMHR